MPKEIVNPPGLFPSLQHGFSQAVVARGTRMVFVSGQTAWDAHKQVIGSDLTQQIQQALHNLRTAVEAAGGGLQDVVGLRVYVVQSAMRDIGAVGAALKAWFPADPPASTWLGVSSLARPEFLVEVEATAVMEADSAD